MDSSAAAFVIYCDPNGGTVAADLYDRAVRLLAETGTAHSRVVAYVQDDVDQLAGVTDSTMPRFFLGDQTSQDCVPEPGVNKGGLRWLKKKVAEMSDDWTRLRIQTTSHCRPPDAGQHPLFLQPRPSSIAGPLGRHSNHEHATLPGDTGF